MRALQQRFPCTTTGNEQQRPETCLYVAAYVAEGRPQKRANFQVPGLRLSGAQHLRAGGIRNGRSTIGCMSEEVSEGYVREKLWQAVDCLATSAEPIQRRLVGAGHYLVRLKPSHFPDDEGRVVFSAIMDSLTTTGDRGRGSLEDTTSRMSDDQAQAAAQQIFSLATRYRGI